MVFKEKIQERSRMRCSQKHVPSQKASKGWQEKNGTIPSNLGGFCPNPVEVPENFSQKDFGTAIAQNPPDQGQSRKIRFSKFPGPGLKIL